MFRMEGRLGMSREEAGQKRPSGTEKNKVEYPKLIICSSVRDARPDYDRTGIILRL